MSRELRQRLEAAQGSVRALSRELARAQGGPRPLDPAQQRTLEALRDETHRLGQKATQAEERLAAATSRRTAAELDFLAFRAAPSRELRDNSPVILLVVVMALVGAWWESAPPNAGLPRPFALLVFVVGGLWLLHDAWQTGRAEALRPRLAEPPAPGEAATPEAIDEGAGAPASAEPGVAEPRDRTRDG